MPLGSAAVGCALLLALALALLPQALAASAVASAAALALAYEWTHFLCHASYRPGGRWLRSRVRHHRLHHFKHERYWLGVTFHAGDWLLRTCPDPRRVETSSRCRDLGAR